MAEMRMRNDADGDGVPNWSDRTPNGRAPSTKIVKVRQGNVDSVLSFAGRRAVKRRGGMVSNAVQNQMLRGGPVGGRSVLADFRGYARGPVSVRGQGRDTGTTDPLKPSARADYLKQPTAGRSVPFGRTRMPGDSI